jgi:hypothetical protein
MIASTLGAEMEAPVNHNWREGRLHEKTRKGTPDLVRERGRGIGEPETGRYNG